MVDYEREAKVTEVLTDKVQYPIKRFLEKNHAIDCMFLLYVDRGKWKNAKDYMKMYGLPLSDGTFRARMNEATDLKLAEKHPIDPLKSYYTITDLGCVLAEQLLHSFEEVKKESEQ